MPGAEYVWDVFCAVLVFPSPKFHEYVLMLPDEVLEKLMASGAAPDVMLAVKLATGAGGGGAAWVTVINPVLVLVLLPPAPVTVRLSV